MAAGQSVCVCVCGHLTVMRQAAEPLLSVIGSDLDFGQRSHLADYQEGRKREKVIKKLK